MVLTMHWGDTLQSSLHEISAPVYVRKKILNPRRKIECNHAKILGKCPNIQFRIRSSIWNVVSISGNWGEISDTLKLCCVDISCLQEVRWKGQGTKIIGNGYKFIWKGGCKAENIVGVMVKWLRDITIE